MTMKMRHLTVLPLAALALLLAGCVQKTNAGSTGEDISLVNGGKLTVCTHLPYKPFQYKAYPGENYYVRGTANTRRMLQDMLEFFDRYLQDGGAVGAAAAEPRPAPPPEASGSR